MRQCSRCASELNEKDKVCPRCGLPVSKMGEAEDALAEEMIKQSKSEKLNKAQKKEKKRLAKLAKKEAKRKRKEESKVSSTDFSKFAVNSSSDEEEVVVSKKKRKKNDNFQFEIDENGEFNIDTKDVEIIGEEVSKIYEERRRKQEYSVKKARGDYRPPKVKWWEIYKLADRAFARRKIKKDVSKAAKMKPDFISKAKLLILSILFGWCGVHNFYARNKKKGFVSLTFLTISVLSMIFNDLAFVKAIEIWLIGFTGFVVISIWVIDVVNIIFNKFEYRIQKEKFISSMNIETRAKLGEKYIDLELLKKPWWVRFKVWCDKKKRNYHEWKQERRQRLIEKEKAKLEMQEEKDKVEQEVAAFEKKELEKLENEKKQEKTAKKQSKKESSETEVVEESKEQKKTSAPKKAKVTVKTNKNNKTNNSKKK